MQQFPKAILDFILALTLESRLPAYLRVRDGDNTLVEWGGNLDAYNISDLRDNIDLDQQVYFLAGLLPLEEQNIFLPSVKVEGGVYADIHVFRDGRDTWVLLLDASPATIEKRQIQQELHDLTLEVNDLQRKNS